MDDLKSILREIAGQLPELQRLVEEASGYALLPREIEEMQSEVALHGTAFSNSMGDLRRLLLSQTEGELPPPGSEDRPWPEFPPEIGGAGLGARRPTPPMPRSPGGERLPDEAREPARNA